MPAVGGGVVVNETIVAVSFTYSAQHPRCTEPVAYVEVGWRLGVYFVSRVGFKEKKNFNTMKCIKYHVKI